MLSLTTVERVERERALLRRAVEVPQAGHDDHTRAPIGAHSHRDRPCVTVVSLRPELPPRRSVSDHDPGVYLRVDGRESLSSLINAVAVAEIDLENLWIRSTCQI